MIKPSNWSDIISMTDNYWEQFKAGNDYTSDNNMLIDQCIQKMQSLKDNYRVNPQGDDRPHRYLQMPKIGLDIDEVLANWIGAWTKKHGMKEDVIFWNFDKEMPKKFEEMKDDKEFWLSIKPLIDPANLPFEPHCYITARSIDKSWTEEWLYDVAGFPVVPVYSVGFGESKVETAIKSGVDIFVDDSFKNFVELNRAGICTYLWDTRQNKKYEVGHKRLYDLKTLIS